MIEVDRERDSQKIIPVKSGIGQILETGTVLERGPERETTLKIEGTIPMIGIIEGERETTQMTEGITPMIDTIKGKIEITPEIGIKANMLHLQLYHLKNRIFRSAVVMLRQW